MNFKIQNTFFIRAAVAFTILLFCFQNNAIAQLKQADNETEKCDPQKLLIVSGTGSLAYVSSMTGLYFLWYSNYSLGKFHFFNDIHGWRMIDKFGHNLSSYYIGRVGYDVMKWACPDEKKAIWYGGTLGLVFLTSVEFFDGLSAGWGASPYDVLANTFGSAAFIGQQLAFGQQYASFKFSYHNTFYQQYNPGALGNSFMERLLKDYNGQTHWLSINVKPVTGLEFIPPWLNLAIGYSANGMINGYDNPTVINGNPIPYFKPYSQYFISFDVDMSRIKTNSRFVNSLFEIINFIKIPFPALELNSNGIWKFHPIYF